MDYRFFNLDCVAGARAHLADGCVDLMVCDPPYGIDGGGLHKHYNRNEEFVVGGYVDVPQAEYADFSRRWIAEAARVLRPGGAIYVVSGYTNLIDVLSALRATSLVEVNHIIWKYNFGVHTRTKYISSHYHILYYRKPGGRHVFNTHCRYSDAEQAVDGGSLNYQDREDVWFIKREYQPGVMKNKNALPTQLLVKMMQYSSNEGDLVCDFFMGGFSTARVAKGLNRRFAGFEISSPVFDYQRRAFDSVRAGYLLPSLRRPPDNVYANRGKPIDEAERCRIEGEYRRLRLRGASKKAAIEAISREVGRGRWSVLRMVEGLDGEKVVAGGRKEIFRGF